MNYFKRVAIAVDQLAATVFLGTLHDETISAAAYRRDWKKTQTLINWLFRDPSYCRNSYLAEQEGTQNATEYRK